VIGAMVFFLLRFTAINLITFIASFFLFYLIFQLFEIRYIQANLLSKKNGG